MTSPPAATTQTFRLRPVRWSDCSLLGIYYSRTFGHDTLLDIFFPTRKQHPEEFVAVCQDIFRARYCVPSYRLTAVVNAQDQPLGFSCWRIPDADLSLWDRWLSPFVWLGPLIRLFFKIRARLYAPNLDLQAMRQVHGPAFHRIETALLTTPRMKAAWYLSILAVDPPLQGRGLGSMLVLDGVARAESRGLATYLVSLIGAEDFYKRHGYREVGRCNVEEFDKWDGGALMFRNL